jgi:hypothetical protein
MELKRPHQRRWERYAVKIRTKITVNQDGKTVSFHGEAGDVSQGGLRLFMPREMEPGVIILMELAIPYSSQLLAIRGLIRNRNGFSYGVEFINPTKHQQDTIAQSCKALQLMQ